MFILIYLHENSLEVQVLFSSLNVTILCVLCVYTVLSNPLPPHVLVLLVYRQNCVPDTQPLSKQFILSTATHPLCWLYRGMNYRWKEKALDCSWVSLFHQCAPLTYDVLFVLEPCSSCHTFNIDRPLACTIKEKKKRGEAYWRSEYGRSLG